MKHVFLALLLIPFFVSAQRATVSGIITQKGSGETLIGASVYNSKTKQGTTSNHYGFYSITLPRDSFNLTFSYVGYKSAHVGFRLHNDTTINLALEDAGMLQEVEVTASPEEEIQHSTRMGTIDVPVAQIKALPALLGEIDVFKVLQLLPGVQSGAEGSSGLYVRGGGPDQNLILLDGVPVYNASHLFGFISVFNADAINHVELIKGGFPARYGGRLSSVIDITMKEGNQEKISCEGSIGLISSRLTVEGPIVKNKSSFIVSARRTYLDVLTRPIIKKVTKGEEAAWYYFYDLNAKVNYHLNERNRVFLSTYTGDDKAFARSRYKSENEIEQWVGTDEFDLKWGNFTAAARWNHIFTSRLFSNVTATYSRYRLSVGAESREVYTTPDTSQVIYYFTDYTSGIRDFGLKVDFDFIPAPSHYIRFGGQAVAHLFTPGVLAYKSENTGHTTMGSPDLHSKEFSVYAEDDIALDRKLKVNAGLHASAFVTDNNFYYSLQPRISTRYLLNNDLSLKASYARMTQYIHLLTNVGIGLPTDLWVPSTDQIKPEESFIASLGTALNFKSAFEISVEAYYKSMEKLIEYKEGANYLNIEEDWQTKVESGKGESYGSELFIQKKKGKVSGWVGYTLSWTNRTFQNINEGKTFPFRYDRRHDVEVALSYKWKPNRDLSMTWVYGTGAAISLPQSAYTEYIGSPWGDGDQSFIEYYGGRNSYRMRAYHRLDIGYTSTKKKRWGERSWNLSLYNAYNRKNPFFVDNARDEKGHKKFIQYSLFPLIPSAACRFKF